MMLRILLTLSLTVLISCAFNNRGRKNTTHSEISINGGVYKNKTWNDKMIFDRVSWFNEATMQYDILVHELKQDSSFVEWLGRDKSYLDECEKFYIGVLYSDFNIGEGVPYLSQQFEKSGLSRKSLMDFTENFEAHNNFSDWRLYEYKVYGYCQESSDNSNIVISIPGYQTQTI